MTIIEKPISEIKPYPGNPRNNERAVEYVANSIQDFGMLVPIVLDREGVILAGHTRLEALKRLGAETAPCVIADALTPDEARAFRLADNRVAEFATWDKAALQEELANISIGVGRYGFTPEPLKIDAKQADDLKAWPFSVLDARTVEWQARAQIWRQGLGPAADAGEDPVLQEVLTRWYGAKTIADPFGAARAARQGVARALGCELVPGGRAGALITEPTYTAMDADDYTETISRAVRSLKAGSFAVVVTADKREPSGAWHSYGDATAGALEAAGAQEQARLVYVEPWAGKRPQGEPDHGRVLRTHKEVVVFFKGDPAKIKRPRALLTLGVPEV